MNVEAIESFKHFKAELDIKIFKGRLYPISIKHMKATHALHNPLISICLLEPLLPPSVGAPEVPSLQREGEEKVVGGGLQEGVPASGEVCQARHLAVVERKVVVSLVGQGHLVETSVNDREKWRRSERGMSNQGEKAFLERQVSIGKRGEGCYGE